LPDIDDPAFAGMFDRYGAARVVLLGEAFTARTGVATIVIVAGVALIVSKPRAARPAPEAIPEAVAAEAVDPHAVESVS